jgi:hypothetical protein
MIIKYLFDVTLIININNGKLCCQIPLPQQRPLFLQLGERTCFGYAMLTPDVAGKYLAVQKSCTGLKVRRDSGGAYQFHQSSSSSTKSFSSGSSKNSKTLS